jgi:hypothetical protein
MIDGLQDFSRHAVGACPRSRSEREDTDILSPAGCGRAQKTDPVIDDAVTA